jgi:hypothetical protein
VLREIKGFAEKLNIFLIDLKKLKLIPRSRANKLQETPLSFHFRDVFKSWLSSLG